MQSTRHNQPLPEIEDVIPRTEPPSEEDAYWIHISDLIEEDLHFLELKRQHERELKTTIAAAINSLYEDPDAYDAMHAALTQKNNLLTSFKALRISYEKIPEENFVDDISLDDIEAHAELFTYRYVNQDTFTQQVKSWWSSLSDEQKQRVLQLDRMFDKKLFLDRIDRSIVKLKSDSKRLAQALLKLRLPRISKRTAPKRIDIEPLKRIPLIQLLPYPPAKTSATISLVLCPFHQERSPSFTIYHKTPHENFFCFGCQASGDAIGLYMKLHNLSFLDAIRKLDQDFHV